MIARVIRLRNDGANPEFGLLLLVKARTGIEYEVQCNGHLCESRRVEGYLVPVGGTASASRFESFFSRRFEGHPYRHLASGWKRSDVSELGDLVRSVTIFDWNHDGTSHGELDLDEHHLSQCTEAWITVRSSYGPAVLIFNNCD